MIVVTFDSSVNLVNVLFVFFCFNLFYLQHPIDRQYEASSPCHNSQYDRLSSLRKIWKRHDITPDTKVGRLLQ